MKKIFIILLILSVALFAFGCGSDDTAIEDDEDYTTGEDYYFGWVETPVVDGDVVLVEYTDSSECTPEALAEWYKQDVEDSGYNYAVIEYTDKEHRGVHAANGVISKNVAIYNHSYTDNTPKTIIYTYVDGHLEE